MFETIESVEFVSNKDTVALICPGSNSSGKPYTLLILINGNYICNWQLFTLEGIQIYDQIRAIMLGVLNM